MVQNPACLQSGACPLGTNRSCQGRRSVLNEMKKAQGTLYFPQLPNSPSSLYPAPYPACTVQARLAVSMNKSDVGDGLCPAPPYGLWAPSPLLASKFIKDRKYEPLILLCCLLAVLTAMQCRLPSPERGYDWLLDNVATSLTSHFLPASQPTAFVHTQAVGTEHATASSSERVQKIFTGLRNFSGPLLLFLPLLTAFFVSNASQPHAPRSSSCQPFGRTRVV